MQLYFPNSDRNVCRQQLVRVMKVKRRKTQF